LFTGNEPERKSLNKRPTSVELTIVKESMIIFLIAMQIKIKELKKRNNLSREM
jgi:hypothetical protein